MFTETLKLLETGDEEGLGEGEGDGLGEGEGEGFGDGWCLPAKERLHPNERAEENAAKKIRTRLDEKINDVCFISPPKTNGDPPNRRPESGLQNFEDNPCRSVYGK
ncbi:MAG: hypothetical protein ACXWPM_07220 [Bdellovibrionota bacterium]